MFLEYAAGRDYLIKGNDGTEVNIMEPKWDTEAVLAADVASVRDLLRTDGLVTNHVLASAMGRTVRTVNKWIADGKIPTVTIGHKRLVNIRGLLERTETPA